MDTTQVTLAEAAETHTATYRGQAITLYREDDSLHGSFWGWKVGDKNHPATYRHYIVALDNARAYVESQVAA